MIWLAGIGLAACATPQAAAPQAPAPSAMTAAPATAPASAAATTAAADSSTPAPTPAAVLQIMEQVADWQLAHPSRDPKDGWIYAAFYTGVMALNGLAPDGKYHDAMLAQGTQNAWKPARRPYMADDHAVTQMYLELYLLDHQPEMIAPTRAAFDYVLANLKDDDLDYTLSGSWTNGRGAIRYSWIHRRGRG